MSWLKNAANQAIAVKFIAASLQGWIYCRDHQAECVQMTLKEGPTLPKGHQTWMMNEINKLVWPNTSGVGHVSNAQVANTAKIAKDLRRDQEDAEGRVHVPVHRPGAE